jgi:glycosyltransferase involved in cell wall biosynthesis
MQVSAIIPTYNRDSSIRRAIASVQAQSFLDWELIICDDGSRDSTVKIVESLSARDPRIKLIVSDRNIGVAHARNMAAKKSKGEYLAFLDSDDKWLPDKLQYQVALMDSLDSTWGASHTGAIVNIVNRKKRIVSKPDKSGHIFNDLLRFNAQIWTPTFMIRSSIYRELGGMDEALLRHQDLDFYRRVAEKYKIAILPEPQAELYIFTNKIFSLEHIKAKEIMHQKYWKKTLKAHGPWIASRVWGREWLVASGCLMRARKYEKAFYYFLKAMRTNPIQNVDDFARFFLNLLRSTRPLPNVNTTDLT